MLIQRMLEVCDSTNALARELGEQGASHGSWICARRQTAGRGRTGRHWESLEGNLFLSIIARVERKELWTWVPLATAVGIVNALEPLAPAAPLAIKWPNDLWLGGAKLGGILCESAPNRPDPFIVIGIGLNLASAPVGLDQPATSLAQAGIQLDLEPSRQLVTAEVLRALERLSGGAAEAGREWVRERYERLAVFKPGTAIRWGDEAERIGVVQGLGSHGELQVELPDGNLQRLYSEDVRIRARGSLS